MLGSYRAVGAQNGKRSLLVGTPDPSMAVELPSIG